MRDSLKTVRVDSLFHVKSGEYHALEELDAGQTPLVSCGEANNGVVGYFDIPSERIYQNALTVAYNGRPLTTKFHPYAFGAKDDVAILTPLSDMPLPTMLYLGALLDYEKWRYSYGRKCYREKLTKFTLRVPYVKDNGHERIHHEIIAEQAEFERMARDLLAGALRQIIPPS